MLQKKKPKNLKLTHLAELRREAGLKQVELAVEMEVSQTTVCLWEHGIKTPMSGRLPELCELLHCTLDELLHGRKKTNRLPKPWRR